MEKDIKISKADKNRLLVQRGFSQEEIDSGFERFRKAGTWSISGISPEELINAETAKSMEPLFCKDSVTNDGTYDTG